MFTDAEMLQLERHGIALEDAQRQLDLLRSPPDPVRLDRPCRLGDGIHAVPESDHAALLELHGKAVDAGRLVKFVPASGAASRMFQALTAGYARLAEGVAEPAVARFLENRERFAFAGELEQALAARGMGGTADPRHVLQTLLFGEGLGYRNRAKGLIPFHAYPDGARTPFEEHLVEGAVYAARGGREAAVHFTVSLDQRAEFEALFARVKRSLRARFRVSFRVGFSHQDPSTDTLAVDPGGEPFRDGDGAILFRPGGHGALLENVERLRGDIVVVKNIDNVVPDARKTPTVLWKKLLAGHLIRLQSQSFELLGALEAGEQGAVHRGLAWCADHLGSIRARKLLESGAGQVGHAYLRDRLDRPLRVCGVVKNQGEPGGGPFWVRGGPESPQIVESSQVDLRDEEQRAQWDASTHFNPVDLVCGVRNRDGEPHDLRRFVDASTVFIARKSHEGRELKALERPGLWNGAMAEWNTVFVEVPIETFAPVKTVFDLLRPEHQPVDPAGEQPRNS